MADFIPTAKNFVRDLASDAVHFPKTTASWPQFKQAVADLYKEFKSDMFSFDKDQRNPVLNAAVTKFDELFKQENTSAKVDAILATSSDARDKLIDISDAQDTKTGWSAGATAATAILGGLAFGGGFALASFMVLAAVTLKYTFNRDAASGNAGVIREKAAAEVQKVEPSLVFASSEAQKMLLESGVLKKVFKAKSFLGGDPEANYTSLVGRLPKSAPAVASPAAPVASA